MKMQSRLLSRPSFRFLLLALLSVALLSCESVRYYSQAARGQLEILLGREDIAALLQDEALPVELRNKLETVLAIRQFAESELALEVADNYATYVDLEREHVVWNVFAAEEFSTRAMEWCYPIAGCVTYRGYFSEPAARSYAQGLQEDGFDVYTGGVDAYSTLGWFDDSLLSTVVNRSDHQLAGLIFHELAHQVVYLPGDTTFNESFATAVEREGVRRWLTHTRQSGLMTDAEQGLQRQQQFAELVIAWRDRFADLYQQELTAEVMRQRKSALQDELRQAYRELQASWGGYAGYDNWFAQPLNNAQLSTVGSYNDLVPEFLALLDSHSGDMEAFFASVRELAEMTVAERAERLASL
jgi:predicted aminopeptidase